MVSSGESVNLQVVQFLLKYKLADCNSAMVEMLAEMTLQIENSYSFHLSYHRQ